MILQILFISQYKLIKSWTNAQFMLNLAAPNSKSLSVLYTGFFSRILSSKFTSACYTKLFIIV